MRSKLKQLTQETVKVAFHSKVAIRSKGDKKPRFPVTGMKRFPRGDEFYDGSGLLEKSFRDHKVVLNHMPVEARMLMSKLNDCRPSLEQESKDFPD